MKDGATRSRGTQTHSPIDVLLACASRESTVNGEDKMRQALGDVSDWDGVLSAADRHGMILHLERCVRTLETDSAPRDVRDALDRRRRASAVATLRLGKQLFSLLVGLQEGGIHAISLKGPALSAQVYGDPLMRHPGDIDLLVDRPVLERAITILEAVQYRETQTHLHPLTRKRIQRQGPEVEMIHDFGAPVEIHWALAPASVSFQPDLAQMRSRAIDVALWGRSVPVLAPEDLLLYLCLHGAKHHWWRLILFCDLAALVRGCPDLDWERLCCDAERWRGRRTVSLGLVLAQRVLGLSLPDQVVSWADDSGVARLADGIERRMLAGETGELVNIRMERFALRVTDRKRDRLTGTLRAACDAVRPQEPDFASWCLPRWLYLLYYGWRPLRLMARRIRRWRTRAHSTNA